MDICETTTHAPNSWRLSASLGVLLMALTACTTAPVAPGALLAHMPVNGADSAFDRARGRFASDLLASIQDHDSADKADKVFWSGMAMLDMQCSRYLDAVGSANQTAANDRRQMSLVSGFAAAMMGMAGSTAKEIAGLTTAFSFAGSSVDSANTAFLFSDAASSVTKIVRESQKVWLDSATSPAYLNGMKNIDAIRLLDAYEQLCRPAAIRSLIDQSVARGTIVVERVQTSDADAVAVLQSLQAGLGLPVTETQAIVLYAWLKHPAQRSTGAKLSVMDPLVTLLTTRTEPVLAAQLARAFLPVSLANSQVPERWDGGVKSLIPAPIPAALPAAPGQGAAAVSTLQNSARVHRRPALPLLSVR